MFDKQNLVAKLRLIWSDVNIKFDISWKIILFIWYDYSCTFIKYYIVDSLFAEMYFEIDNNQYLN